MAERDVPRARRLWQALEPVHAVTYFAPEPQRACEALGARGFWTGYFGQRAAPLGAAPPELVTALFYNFHPGLVAKAVTRAWALAPPERFLEVRLSAVDAALRRLLGPQVLESAELAELAGTARAAAEAAPTAGRALAAANAALDWPGPAHLVLWHAQTLLREHRGDGHVAALLTAGLDPAEALVLFAADTGLGAEWMRTKRGWSEAEWAAATDRLTARGLLVAGEPTDAGRVLRAEVEARTDALADVPWAAVGDARVERAVALAAPVVAAIRAGGAFLDRNPMGLRPLVPTAPAP
jgi:helix-turn-helix protein